MIPVVNNSCRANDILKTQSKVNTSSHDGSSSKKVMSFLQNQLKTGGLFGDIANCLKLSNFWSVQINGAVTDSSKRMTDAGGVIKNYMGILEMPDKLAGAKKTWVALGKGTAESVGDFVEAVAGVGKSFFDGVELVGTKFNLLSKKTVDFFSPLSGFGAFTFGTNQAVFKNIPALKESVGEDSGRATSQLLKLVKHVSIAVVGALSLIARFFCSINNIGVIIPSLLTVYATTSIAGRFFDGLVLQPKPARL